MSFACIICIPSSHPLLGFSLIHHPADWGFHIYGNPGFGAASPAEVEPIFIRLRFRSRVLVQVGNLREMENNMRTPIPSD